MYQIKVDPHTHTLASGHAFSTIGENVACAKQAGLEAIGMSEHFGPVFSLYGGPSTNLPALPKVIDGVRVLASVEIDIMDFQGHLGFWDQLLPPKKPGGQQRTKNDTMLDSRDYTIASVHGFPNFRDGSVAQNTELYCRVLDNPQVQIIGHPGRAGLRFDLDEVCGHAKEHGKMLEINEHSFDFDSNITDECRRIALCCAKLGTQIVVSSDAHSAWCVGGFSRALAMLEEISFPVELIANRTLDSFLQAIRNCT